ncbi:MAG: ABC transporter ATP-binding protein [bacterium]|nr:ABC transporter ATP-binding protein [bacterium]
MINGSSPEPEYIVETAGLKRYFHLGGSEVRALDGVDLRVARGEFVSIVGASGSGKSTLLNLLAGLDHPTSGSIQTTDGQLTTMSPGQLARYRAFEIGLIFQSFNLIAHQTALINVEMALLFLGVAKKERQRRSIEVLTRLGLGDRLHHRPDDLSGGEQQRVAVARALVKNPKLMLADEPTGNLDKDNSRAIIQVLAEWNQQGGTVILVTHNLDLARQHSQRLLQMDFGKMVSDSGTGGQQT